MKIATPENKGLVSDGKVIAAPKVLLAETSRLPYIALLAMDLAKAGSDVFAVCPTRHPMFMTQAVRQAFPYSGIRPVQSLIHAIEATAPDIIIPCDDRAVRHLHELHAQACNMGALGNKIITLIEKSIGSPNSYAVVSSRYALLSIAREAQLRVPETQQINSLSDLKSWQRRCPFPWVLKADGTYGGHGVRIVHSLEQAESFLEELTHFYRAGRAIKRLWINRDAFWLRPWWNGVSPAVSVQSYIRGYPANCAAVCWKGEVLACIGVKVVSTSGETGSAGVVRVIDKPADMLLCAERLARRLNLSGFFGLDFMVEEGTDLTYLIEMNPRPTRVSRLQLGKDWDLIGALYARLSNQPMRDIAPVTKNKMIAYYPDAWHAKSEYLDVSFHDVPKENPDLLRELRRPWPTATLLWRLADQGDRVKQFLRGTFRRSTPAGNGQTSHQNNRPLAQAEFLD